METATTLALALSIVVGLVNCFYGYRLQRLWIGVICFLVGLLGGYAACAVLLQEIPVWVSLLVGFACGAVLAVLSYKLALAGVFLFAGGTTYWACRLLIAGPEWAAVVVGLLVALLVGFLAVWFTRVVMILSTALSGGLTAVKALLLLVPVASVSENPWLPFAGGAALAALGIFVQYRTDAAARRRKHAHEAAKAAREESADEEADAVRVPVAGRAPMPEPLPLDGPADASEAPPEETPEP